MTSSQKFSTGLTIAVMVFSLVSLNISAAFAWACVLYMGMQMREREKHYNEVIGTAQTYEEAAKGMWGEPDLPQSEAAKNTPLKKKHKVPEHLKIIRS
jgi:hypothetical protein